MADTNKLLFLDDGLNLPVAPSPLVYMYVGVFYLLTIDPSRSVKEKTCNILPTPIQPVQYIDCEFLPCLKAFSAGTRVFCCIFLTSNTASFPYQITGNDFIHALIATRAPTESPPPPPPPPRNTLRRAFGLFCALKVERWAACLSSLVYIFGTKRLPGEPCRKAWKRVRIYCTISRQK